jgi:KipI family sensor histidine kinase inhibitor
MRVLPSGSEALLVELDDLDQVLALYTALCEQRPAGVVDIVPAARTVLLVIDPAATDLGEAERALLTARPRPDRRTAGELVEVAVTYDGEDLDEVGSLLGCDVAEVVRRHSSEEWIVAFCGFAPGFGYLTSATGAWDVPRRSSPRTVVPPGSVALAGEFSGVYPRASPGGWQLIGHTELAVFDLHRDPPALLRPGTPVRFVNIGRA